MVTPARTQRELLDGDPAYLLASMSDGEKTQIWRQRERNREHLFSRWKELTRDHRGRWAAAYGDCEIIIGDSREELHDRLFPDRLLGAFIWELGDPPGVVRVPG